MYVTNAVTHNIRLSCVMMYIMYSSEALIPTYQTTLRHTPEFFPQDRGQWRILVNTVMNLQPVRNPYKIII
jgi:hypothetical protein